MKETISKLRMFLYENVYRNYRVHNEFVKAQKIIRELYDYFLDHEFPRGETVLCEPDGCALRTGDGEKVHRRVCDFIAGMTDRYALGLYNHIFMPKPWTVF
jgi:dGTPase